MITITTAADLRTWIQNNRPDVTDQQDEDELVEYLLEEPHPPWGSDWQAYLAEVASV